MPVFLCHPLRRLDEESGWADAFREHGRRLSAGLGRAVAVGPEWTMDATILQDKPAAWFERLGETLAREGIPCSVHLPFWDLHPASPDDNILEATRRTLSLALDRAALLRPRHLVGHCNYNHHIHVRDYKSYLDRAAATWGELLASHPGHAPLRLENTHEFHPEPVRDVVARLAERGVGVCFDIGHWHSFSLGHRKRDLDRWLEAFGPYLQVCHIHDNTGAGDEHLGPGQGSIPFGAFFAGLAARGLRPTLTLEPHGEEALSDALSFLEAPGSPWRDWL